MVSERNNNEKHIDLRITAELKQRLAEAAKESRRSVNSQILFLIEKGLENR